ncbi:MAG TPA: iron ABC transporter substrate-binding protein [Acidimicrobiia bacterium]|nr:iron ABC transporter substrate-binding protein [Acidimicrobiia bacterium]
MSRRVRSAVLALLLTATACGGTTESDSITVYVGRSEALVAPLIARFEVETGITVEARYASSTDLAATLREEGANSPADVFFAQDPASLGAVAEAGMFRTLSAAITSLVPDRFSDSDGRWVGVSGRSRVVVYDTTRLAPSDLPDDIDGFTDPAWRGRIGIAPSNASFLAFVAAMIIDRGEEATAAWLEGIAANEPQLFSGNAPIVAAIDDGTVEVGLVNHYYLLGLIADQGSSTAANHFFVTAGPESLVMPAGAGILTTSDSPTAAEQFIEFLLSEEAQNYFAAETFEYPLIAGLDAPAELPPLESLAQPDLDLSALATVIDRATDLVAAAGLL